MASDTQLIIWGNTTMSRVYNGKKMIEASRFVNLYKGLKDNDKQTLTAKTDSLVSENGEYLDDGNHGHLCNIFSAMAVYELLTAQKGREQALKELSEEMWAFVENGTAKTYRKLFKLPGMLRLLGKLLPKMFAKGSGYGREYVWHNDTATDKYLQFECTSCIYAKIFAKYNVRELGPVFCYCDDINYGKIPGITFKREHTLCKDGQACDFLFEKEEK